VRQYKSTRKIKEKARQYRPIRKDEERVRQYKSIRRDEVKASNNEYRSLSKDHAKLESAHHQCMDHAYRIPIFLSTTTHLNNNQQRFLNRLVYEIENALLFPRTLPLSESYPESILTDIRRLVSSSYGMLALNLRRFEIETVDVNVGPPSIFHSILDRFSLFSSRTFNGFPIWFTLIIS